MAKRLLVERRISAGGEQSGVSALAGERRSGRSVTVNLAESPLGWLFSRGHITPRQFDAGEQLRMDWERSQLPPSVTMRWEATPVGAAHGPGLNPTEAQIAARRRFEAAVAATEPGLSDMLWRIVCAGEGMREAETALGWPARAGKVVLGIALDRLADHYGMR